MPKNEEIHQYYNQLASEYDSDRFGNSYGQFIHAQEVNLLSKHIPKSETEIRILDLGCGTGRLSEFATDGLDFSEKMLEIAQSKHPEKQFHLGSVSETTFEENTFDFVFCFHVFMHLSEVEIEKSLAEIHRILKPNGIFLFDIPSEARRKLLGKTVEGWHGATSFSVEKLRNEYQEKWNFLEHEGIMFFPIHTFPKAIRQKMLKLDSLINRTFLKKWASYNLVKLQNKKAL
ncbi:MAG: ubiquinone/menaquinone biosynthesis C-methylase UbiE [Flammeovirgaceae bacterium]|jgi:ubiquinone/menaquinone biosynthesis C-methylase UbiE